MRTRLLLPALLSVGVGACTGAAGIGDVTAGRSGAGGDATGGLAGTGGAPIAGGTSGAGGAGVGGAGAGTGGASDPGTGGQGLSGGGSGGRGVGGGGSGGGGAGGAASGTGGAGGAGAGRGGASGRGGAPGLPGGEAWLTGYTATMFGNVTTASDCGGVANFTDMTNISSANCTHQGIAIAPFSRGAANNASYYGAPGDESSIWAGPVCSCQRGAAENAAGACPQAPSCNMESDCGRCFEVRCDPNGAGTYSDGVTRVGAMYCNPNQSVVIQVIDACPHNHPTNVWWCKNQRSNHIDLSCSAMRGIAGNPNNVGAWGWLNVQVRPVNCSVGLGVKLF
jgi:Lytic transglycolase